MSKRGFDHTREYPTIEKDPEGKLSYTFQWKKWLDNEGTTLSTTPGDSVMTVPDGITKVSQSIDATKGETDIELTGGTDKTDYTIANHIVAANGAEDTRRIVVQVRER